MQQMDSALVFSEEAKCYVFQGQDAHVKRPSRSNLQSYSQLREQGRGISSALLSQLRMAMKVREIVIPKKL